MDYSFVGNGWSALKSVLLQLPFPVRITVLVYVTSFSV